MNNIIKVGNEVTHNQGPVARITEIKEGYVAVVIKGTVIILWYSNLEFSQTFGQ